MTTPRKKSKKVNYDAIVYQRKGTNIIIPETEANRSDPNLVPMTVKQAIEYGYIADPTADQDQSTEEFKLQEENNRLREQMIAMQETQKLQLQAMEKLTRQLDEQQAIAENKVSVGSDIKPTSTLPDAGSQDEVIPPAETVPVEVPDASEYSEVDQLETQIDDAAETQAALDALIGKPSEA